MTQDILFSKIFDLALGRALKNVYLSLSEDDKTEMEKIFSMGTDEDKEKFFKKHKDSFERFFSQETENIKKDLIEKIELQP